MKIRKINQTLYILKTHTIQYTNIQALPVDLLSTKVYLNFSLYFLGGQQ